MASARRPGPPEHRCPGGCGRWVPHHQLACPDDWYRLPQELRDGVVEAWKAKQRNRSDAAAAVAHLLAVREADAWYRTTPRSTP